MAREGFSLKNNPPPTVGGKVLFCLERRELGLIQSSLLAQTTGLKPKCDRKGLCFLMALVGKSIAKKERKEKFIFHLKLALY